MKTVFAYSWVLFCIALFSDLINYKYATMINKS